MTDIIRVLRVIEYVGEREWVERTITRSIHGTKLVEKGSISAATIGSFPEILGEVHPKKESTE